MSQAVVMLQSHLSRLGYQPGALDGRAGPKTTAALDAAGLSAEDVDAALSVLAERLQLQRAQIPILTPARFRALAPTGKQGWLPGLNSFLVAAHITEDRLAFTLAQLAHESGGFKFAKEQGRGPDTRYWPYIGRGPIQLTWERNYAAAGDWLGLDLVNHPAWVEQPAIGWQCAAWYWINTGLNAHTDAGDFEALTRAINGGTNGIKDRRQWLERAAALFPWGGGQIETRPRKSRRRRPTA